VIRDEPTYVDAYLRLAYLARNRGDMQRAFDYIEQAKKNQVKKPEEFSKPINQCCIKGKLMHDIRETQLSQD
jgi:tetratricopeptide (TPR) repeat protein